MRQLISWISIFLLAHEMSAQQHLQFQVKVDSRLGNESFIPGASVTIESDTILCSNLLVYLGGFILWNKGVEVAHWPLDYFLVDFSDTTTTSFELPLKSEINFDKVSFLVGVDSTLQVDGPHGGSLDPAEGMYWTWQNGYIYTKLEGTSSQSDGSKGEFEWHLGGYAGALNAAVRCEFPISKKHLELTIDWTNLFRLLDMKRQHHVMSPSSTAVRAMKALKSGVTAR